MITVILGRRELGKSTLALFIARQTSTRVIFDPRKQYSTSTAIFTGQVGPEFFEALDTRSEIIVQPTFNVIQTFEQMCEELSDWIGENPNEPLTLLVDEARFVETSSGINPYFDWILRCTPRKTVNVIFTAHRPVDIAVDIRSIADFWIMFHTTQEHDLKVIGERCGPQVEEIVRELKPQELVIWNDSRATYRKEMDRGKWFVPMYATMTTEEARQ